LKLITIRVIVTDRWMDRQLSLDTHSHSALSMHCAVKKLNCAMIAIALQPRHRQKLGETEVICYVYDIIYGRRCKCASVS